MGLGTLKFLWNFFQFQQSRQVFSKLYEKKDAFFFFMLKFNDFFVAIRSDLERKKCIFLINISFVVKNEIFILSSWNAQQI